MSSSPSDVTRETLHVPGHGFRTYYDKHKCGYGCDPFCDEDGQITREYVTEEAFRDWALARIEEHEEEFRQLQKAHERFVEAVSSRGIVIPISELINVQPRP